MSTPREALQILPQRARIVAEDCIGCAKCLDACPVDAIIGAQRQLHVVIAEQCTGCELCIPPCPVDCIELDSVHREDENTLQLVARATFYAQRKVERFARTVSAYPQAELTEIDTLNRAQAKSAVADVMARAQSRRG